MNKLFHYDDKYVYTVVSLIVSMVFLALSFILMNIIDMFFICLLTSIIGLIGSIYIFNIGIHFDYVNNRIIIIDSLWIRRISMTDVKYITFNEIIKPRKKRRLPFSVDALYGANWMDSSKYVYRNGKTYEIVFHLKNSIIINTYYGWLFKAKSERRVLKQEEILKNLIEQFMKSRNNKV